MAQCHIAARRIATIISVYTESPIMSVAFRRESDDEHKEPAYELPITVGPNLVTPRGLRMLGDEMMRLAGLIAGEADEEARKKLQRQLRYFGTRHATAEVQSPPADGRVGIGSRVRYRLNKATREVTIVGGDEADPARGHIAFTAPLARALMGTEVGETVEFQDRDDAVCIVAVTADAEVAA